jgi:two-component system, chemotaxis family, protein-glutamate methylesterase/glutaminase
VSLATLPQLGRRMLEPGERIRVLIVDDSVVIRRLVTHALEQEPLLEIVGSASNGRLALAKVEQLKPDVITLDVEMPEMDGLETLRQLRKIHSTARVIMFSTLTARGASVTLEALSLGAADYVAKVSNDGELNQSLTRLRDDLVPKIKQFFQIKASAPAAAPVAVKPSAVRGRLVRPEILAIGVSTGGPTALESVIPKLRRDFPLPVVIVQHMPRVFTRLLAERLDLSSQLSVKEAAEGDLVEPGRVLIAPGDYHMKIGLRGGRMSVQLDQSPHLNSCRPAVDALLESLASSYRGAVLTTILTGMGQDGLRGAAALHALGGQVIVQDEATSVVWGMPGAVANAGLSDSTVPLDRIVDQIESRLKIA